MELGFTAGSWWYATAWNVPGPETASPLARMPAYLPVDTAQGTYAY